MIIQEKVFETLHALPFVCGPIDNNTYALFDEESGDCVVIDPSFSFDRVLAYLGEKGFRPREYWLTHAHFDHIIGTGYPESRELAVPARLHPKDEILFDEALADMKKSIPFIKDCPRPVTDLSEDADLHVGKYAFKALFTPGHAPGHCCFYCEQAGWLFSGDLVFCQSYGRTDLTGGDLKTLVKSIRERVLTLPPETLIFPGHEEFTRVEDEKNFWG